MTTKNVNFKVHHVARIEGHGNIIVNAKDGKIEEVKWEVPESPRFFESMLRGLSYSDVNFIAPRICGICAVAHATASIEATEAAFDVKLSEQSILLRDTALRCRDLHQPHTAYLFPDRPGLPGRGQRYSAGRHAYRRGAAGTPAEEIRQRLGGHTLRPQDPPHLAGSRRLRQIPHDGTAQVDQGQAGRRGT